MEPVTASGDGSVHLWETASRPHDRSDRCPPPASWTQVIAPMPDSSKPAIGTVIATCHARVPGRATLSRVGASNTMPDMPIANPATHWVRSVVMRPTDVQPNRTGFARRVIRISRRLRVLAGRP